MATKFSQFNNGGAIVAGDQIVGLRAGTNTRFTAPALPVQPWTTLIVGQALAPENGYFLANAVPATFTLPAVILSGELIEIVSTTAQICTIAQNAGQRIFFGNAPTTIGVGGSIATSAIGDSVTLICAVANTTFFILNAAQGIWTIV